MTIQTVLSLALSNEWQIHQLNVKNMFLHLHLQETVCMHQPMAFVIIYIQIMHHGLGTKDLLTTISLWGSNIANINFFLSQQKYATEFLERAGMTSCHPTSTPVDSKAKLSSTDRTLLPNRGIQYCQLAGDLQYLTFTWLHISYTVQKVCMHTHAPRTSLFNALKQILRYIKGILSHGLHLHKSPSRKLVAYTNTDWASCPVTRCSTFGHCVYLGDNVTTRNLHSISKTPRTHTSVLGLLAHFKLPYSKYLYPRVLLSFLYIFTSRKCPKNKVLTVLGSSQSRKHQFSSFIQFSHTLA
uniref:Reverse transcriptase Ty1/copia-type domain-containing protein n=1 Tax=Lactuca sativa TaxID=4236 RepID=A0A9R1XXU9_LACSA|nr:hypothetical protein LSAT_V11C100034940 [Lactuca sativa]